MFAYGLIGFRGMRIGVISVANEKGERGFVLGVGGGVRCSCVLRTGRDTLRLLFVDLSAAGGVVCAERHCSWRVCTGYESDALLIGVDLASAVASGENGLLTRRGTL